jgi:hypothetical protein
MNRFLPEVVARRSAFQRSRLVIAFSLIAIPALTGCSSIKVKLGMRIALAKTPVLSIAASLPNNPGIAPGEKSPLVVEVTDATGKVLVTEGKGKGKVQWKDLVVTPTVVSVNKKGVLSLPKDPRVSDGKTGHVIITVPSHPGIQTDLDIPLRYNYKFIANFSGAPGFNGTDGTAGIDGTSGTSGSIDPNNPSPGGNGGDGTNGGDGSNGGDGGDGPSVQVRATLRPGPQPLLQIGVSTNGKKERYFLVDPQGGSFTVSSNGGSAGSGGKGGRGGSGGSGGIGTPNGSSGSNGASGQDGHDGSAGRGRSVTVTYDPQVQPFLTAIHVSNPGGPAPVFQQQPVAPLW